MPYGSSLRNVGGDLATARMASAWLAALSATAASATVETILAPSESYKGMNPPAMHTDVGRRMAVAMAQYFGIEATGVNQPDKEKSIQKAVYKTMPESPQATYDLQGKRIPGEGQSFSNGLSVMMINRALELSANPIH